MREPAKCLGICSPFWHNCALAALKVLDRWRGRWQVTTTTTQPVASVAKSLTTNTWILGDRFLQGEIIAVDPADQGNFFHHIRRPAFRS